MRWPERARLGGEILAIYARARWLLWRRDLPAAVAALRGPSAPSFAAAAAVDPWRYAHAVVRALGPLPLDSRCLVRSLVLLALLARRGVETTLVVGTVTEPSFGAHAWVERDGEPLLCPGPAFAGRLVEL